MTGCLFVDALIVVKVCQCHARRDWKRTEIGCRGTFYVCSMDSVWQDDDEIMGLGVDALIDCSRGKRVVGRILRRRRLRRITIFHSNGIESNGMKWNEMEWN
mmetsp:Transcript_42171/g.46970  ORF Transcript_42171/g.46970 Transcript_42171/m.46970 type:complete len:102 (-) Transcript_42171:99-404(-)